MTSSPAAPRLPRLHQALPITLALWAASCAPCLANTGSQSADQRLSVFMLIGFIFVFGYLMYSSYTLNSRIDRLDASLASLPVGDGAAPATHEPFSWDPALSQGRNELTLFGEELPLSVTGLHLVTTPEPELTATIATNLVCRSIALDSTHVIFASSTTSMEALGQRILSLEAGVSWNKLPMQEQDRHLRRLSTTLARYQSHLHLVTDLEPSADAIHSAVQAVLKNDPGAYVVVVLEDPNPLHGSELPTAWLERLRNVSAKGHAPVLTVSTVDDASQVAAWQSAAGEGVKSIVTARFADESRVGLAVDFVRTWRKATPAKVEVNRSSAQIVSVL